MKKRQNNEAEWREVYLDDLGHLRALRGGFILCLIVFLLTFCIGFYFSKNILDFILHDGKEIGYEFIYISPIEIMAEQIKLAFIVSFIITLPIMLCQILIFITPTIDGSISALIKIFVYALILFLLGAAFSYYILVPSTFKMFFNLGLETKIVAQISVQKYVDLYVTLITVLGVVFEIPLIAAFLSAMGLIKSSVMAQGRLIALLVIMAISNIITPTTDIFTATLVDIPMYALYEVSILVCKHIEKKKARLKTCVEE